MKIRRGFISNSSSSSFIVIDSSGAIDRGAINALENRRANADFSDDEHTLRIPFDIVGMSEHLEFGWSFEKRDSFSDRLAFACLQACYHDKEKEDRPTRYRRRPNVGEWHNMITEAIKLADPTIRTVEYFVTSDWAREPNEDAVEGYIDHQSSFVDGQNCEMFDNIGALYSFLFGKGSYIKTGNDNDDPPVGYYER